MLKVNGLIMETCKFVVILLLYCVTAAYCYPSRPLNERSPPELTWQAWLLLDDQNQNKQQTNADGMLRRRITPKSVFIAPSFTPESLPACADGYTSDVMGRCVPIIKIDEDAHYGFLIARLKEKFGMADYDYPTEEEVSTQGPLQFNIPLGVDSVNGDEEEETDVAIVISPTKALSANLDKRDSADDEKKQEFFLKKLAESTTKKSVETTAFGEGTEETSTQTEGDTTEPLATTEDIASTVTHNTKRSTDQLSDDTATTTTEEFSETTTEELPETTTDELPDPTTVPVALKTTEISTSAPKLETTKTQASAVVKFPEESGRSFQNSFVKFPNNDVTFQTQIPSSLESSSDTHDFSNDAPAQSGRKIVFRESQPEQVNLDYSNGVRHLPPTTTPRVYNRRNRDKSNSMFLLPPRWSEPNFQKPLILRFSRKHAYLDQSQFKQQPDYYRRVPMDDYAFLFNKHRQSNHR